VCAKSQSERELDILQKLDGVGNKLREATKQVEYREALKNTCILDRYVEGTLALILNFDLFVKANYVRAMALSGHARSANNFTVAIFYDNTLNSGVGHEFQHDHMLVRNIEIVKGPDNAVLTSFVRLYLIDDALKQGGAEGLYFDSIKGDFQLFPCVFNGEIPVTSSTRNGKVSRLALKSLDEANPCEIERGAEIVDSVSGDKRQLQAGIREVWNCVFQVLKSSLTVFLNCSDVLLMQAADSNLQILNMLIGPLNLQTSVPKRCVHNEQVITFG
jgi:hypothetical protein